MNNNKWRIINGKLYHHVDGKGFVIDNRYDSAWELSATHSVVRCNKSLGCIDSEGNVIIPIIYDTIGIVDGVNNSSNILCGRGGQEFTGINNNDKFKFTQAETSIYTGVYDLYSNNGDLLLGGFSEHKYDNQRHLYCFLFGRTWKLYPREAIWEKSTYTKSDFNAKWIVLDENFIAPFKFSFCPDKGQGADWSTFFFRGSKLEPQHICLRKVAGTYYPSKFVSEYTWKKNSEIQSTLLIDLPDDILFDEIEPVSENCIKVKKQNKYGLIYIKLKKISNFFDYIQIIDDEYAIVLDDNYLGLLRNGELVLPCSYEYITRPINDWVFAFREYPLLPNNQFEGRMYVRLIDLNNGKIKYDFSIRHQLLACENVENSLIDEMLNRGMFKLNALYPAKSDLGSICFQYPSNSINLNVDITHNIGKLSENIDIKEDNGCGYHLWDYFWSVESLDRKRNPRKYIEEEPIEEHYGLLDALDGEWDAYCNID